MDPLITAAARAHTASAFLGALNRVALRDDEFGLTETVSLNTHAK
jgi:hypothetical protein